MEKATDMADSIQSVPQLPRIEWINRHTRITRITHWINVVALSLLLMSGLQIFNAHPRLYWGQYGADADKPWLSIASIAAKDDESDTVGITTIGSRHFDTTGVLGVQVKNDDEIEQGFPSWITVPSDRDLATGRRWHFLFAWIFTINGLLYLSAGLINGHLRRDILPHRQELKLRTLGHDIWEHVRLKFPKGEAARHYNIIQKFTYILILFIILPMMVLTGLAMSPGVNAALPLVDLFGGRASARSLHFITANLIVLFIIVHVALVMLAGFWNLIRSMVTGKYKLVHGIES